MKRKYRRLRRRRPWFNRAAPSTNTDVIITTVSKQLILHPLSPLCIRKNDIAFSDVEFDLPGFLQFDTNIRAIRLSLCQASIPISFYLINENNNKIVFLIRPVDSQQTYELVYYASTGSYDYEQFSENFAVWKKNLQLEEFAYNYAMQDALQHLMFVFDPTKSKFILHKNSDDFVEIVTAETTAREIVGLNDLTNDNFVLEVGITSREFPALADFLGPYYILISSEAIPLRHVDTRAQRPFVFSIPIYAKAFDTYVHQSSISESVSLNNSFSFERLDLQITDDKGSLLNFNGVPWSIVMQFDIDYELDTNWKQLELTVLDSYPKDFP